MVDIEHRGSVALAKMLRDNLHITRQHYHITAIMLYQPLHFGVRVRLVVGVDRHMVEGDIVPCHHAAQLVVVGNHARNVTIQLATVPAM